MQNVHPLVVHFPIALLIVAFVFELISDLAGNTKLKSAATYNLILGTMAAWPAVASGLWAEQAVDISGTAHKIVEKHELFAFITAAVSTVLLAWHRSYTIVKGSWIKWGLYLALVVLLTVTGLLGGRLVFEFGVGSSVVG